MKLKELQKELENFDPDMEVCIIDTDYFTLTTEKRPIRTVEEKVGVFVCEGNKETHGKYISIY